MPKIIVQSIPREYSFDINGQRFICLIEWKPEKNIRPVDILMRDLEDCLNQLRSMPEFKVEKSFELPPLNPEK